MALFHKKERGQFGYFSRVSTIELLVCLPLLAAAQLPSQCQPSAEIQKALVLEQSARVYNAAGKWFAQQGAMACAQSAFSAAVAADDESAEAHYNLALTDMALRQPAAAAQQLRLTLRLQPDLLVAHTSLGSALLDLHQPREAEGQFRMVLQADPHSVPAMDHLAQAMVAQRRPAPAITLWRQALAIEPDSPDIEMSLGVALYQENDAKGAITTLLSLLAKHPDNKTGHFDLANIYAHESRYAEAAVEYQKTLQLDSGNDEALLARVKALTITGAYSDALGPSQNYVQRKPADGEGHLLLGSVYKGLGEYGKAEGELRVAVHAIPEDFQAQYELGFVLARNEKPEEARAHLEKAVTLKPEETSAQFQLAAVLRTLGDTAGATKFADEFKKNKERQFKVTQLAAKGNQASELLQSGQAARAAAVYREMIELDPRNAHTEYNLALALAAAHDRDGERAALMAAVRLDESFAVAQSELGYMELTDGHLGEAQKWFERALATDPQLASAQGNLGVLCSLRGKNNEAEALFRESIENDPKYGQGYLNLALILAARERFGEAERAIEHALQLMPDDQRTLSAAGRIKLKLTRPSEAIALFERAVKASPSSSAAHLDLAVALADAFNLPRAFDEADQGVRFDEHSASAYFERGRIEFDMGRAEAARQDFVKASKLSPEMGEPHQFLAILEKQAGHYAEAVEQLDLAVKAQPRNVRTWHLLGHCLEAEGRAADAANAWRQGLAVDPDDMQLLSNLAQVLKGTDDEGSARLTAHLADVQKHRHISDRASSLASDALASMRANDWPDAMAQLREALQVCGECSAKADLHKNLGLAYCHAGDLKNGEAELRVAEQLRSGDPQVASALSLIAMTHAGANR